MHRILWHVMCRVVFCQSIPAHQPTSLTPVKPSCLISLSNPEKQRQFVEVVDAEPHGVGGDVDEMKHTFGYTRGGSVYQILNSFPLFSGAERLAKQRQKF